MTQFAVMHRFINQLHAHQTKAKGDSRAGRTLGRVLTRYKRKKMRGNVNSAFVVEIIELESFVNSPPRGFTVESRAGCRVVKWDPENSCVFIDEIQSSKGKVIFSYSPGR